MILWEQKIESQSIANNVCYQILVVDDLLDVRVLLTKLLQRMGHCVKAAESAAQALVLLNDFHADIIFSDISMPDMDGYELVRVLRRRPDTRLRYIVAMTGNGALSSEQASLAAGFDAHLKKPFSLSALHQLLAERC